LIGRKHDAEAVERTLPMCRQVDLTADGLQEHVLLAPAEFVVIRLRVDPNDIVGLSKGAVSTASRMVNAQGFSFSVRIDAGGFSRVSTA